MFKNLIYVCEHSYSFKNYAVNMLGTVSLRLLCFENLIKKNTGLLNYEICCTS